MGWARFVNLTVDEQTCYCNNETLIPTSCVCFVRDYCVTQIEISRDYELSRRITCEASMKWCRKLRVGVVHELNLPKYKARVRFTRPPNNDLGTRGDPVPLNNTIPIVGEIRIECIPASYTGFECAIRYGFNLVSMGVLFWPKTGLFATLLGCRPPP